MKVQRKNFYSFRLSCLFALYGDGESTDIKGFIECTDRYKSVTAACRSLHYYYYLCKHLPDKLLGLLCQNVEKSHISQSYTEP